MSTQVLAQILRELHRRYGTDGIQQRSATMPTNPRLQAYRDAERMERGWHTANFPLHIRQNYIDNASGTQACLALRAAMALVREKDVQLAAKDAQIAARDAQIQAYHGRVQLLIDAVKKLRQLVSGMHFVMGNYSVKDLARDAGMAEEDGDPVGEGQTANDVVRGLAAAAVAGGAVGAVWEDEEEDTEMGVD